MSLLLAIFASPRLSGTRATERGFDHIAQGVDVFGAVTTSFHQHMGKFITLIVELFVIHVQGGIGLDLVIEGAKSISPRNGLDSR